MNKRNLFLTVLAVLSILVILIVVITFSLQICGQAGTFGKNIVTGQCRMFPNTCLGFGYSNIHSIDECDCDNLETSGGIIECKLNKGEITGEEAMRQIYGDEFTDQMYNTS